MQTLRRTIRHERSAVGRPFWDEEFFPEAIFVDPVLSLVESKK